MDRSIPHDDRWPLLKEVIIDLYINKGMSIPKMANHMKDVYDFDAQSVDFINSHPLHLPTPSTHTSPL